MKLIVGLGNPGEKYAGTRHNVGYDVVGLLAARWRIEMAVEKFHGWFGKGEAHGEPVVLLKPTTFMNRSGRAVVAVGRFFKLEPSDLMVVSDDMALPLGRVRLRSGGSAGSHNGLQDIIDRMGGSDWPRLRVGVGESLGNSASYVLGRFSDVEKPAKDRGYRWAADAVECWIEDGLDEAMNRYNGDPPLDG